MRRALFLDAVDLAERPRRVPGGYLAGCGGSVGYRRTWVAAWVWIIREAWAVAQADADRIRFLQEGLDDA